MINYLCGPFKHTLSLNSVLKIGLFSLELWDKKHYLA